MDCEKGKGELSCISEKTASMEFPAMCIMLILCCYALFPVEHTSGVSKLLESTLLGRSYLAKRKLWISMAFTLIIAVFGLLLGFVTVQTYASDSVRACQKLGSICAYAVVSQYRDVSAPMPCFKAFGLYDHHACGFGYIKNDTEQYIYIATVRAYRRIARNFQLNGIGMG